jgi:hypothetical protein
MSDNEELGDKVFAMDLENNTPQIKTVILQGMYNNGDISEEVYEKYQMNYAVIVKKASFFCKAMEKVLGKEDANKQRFFLVEQKSFIWDKEERSKVNDV